MKLLKLIYLFVLFKLTKKKKKIELHKMSFVFKKIGSFFIDNCLVENIIVGLIYNNLIYISFQGFSQFSLTFTFNFVDRINCVCAFSFLFLTLILSLTFYPFIYATNKKNISLFL
jgi:hypothetical protein